MLPALQDREAFLRQLEDTENWLYEDGECEVKQVYNDKLTALKVCDLLECIIRYADWEVERC